MKSYDLSEALRKAFAIGTEYWRLADSDAPQDWAKADKVKARFEVMVKELVAKHTED